MYVCVLMFTSRIVVAGCTRFIILSSRVAMNNSKTFYNKVLLEKQFYASVKILLKLSQLFGAAPINLNIQIESLRTQRSRWTSIKKPSKKKNAAQSSYTNNNNILLNYDRFKVQTNTFVHRAWCTVIFLALLTAMYSQHQEFDVSQRLITRFLYTGVYLMTIVNITITIIGSQWQRHCYSEYIFRFVDIDMQLLGCGGRRKRKSYGELRRFVHILLGIGGAIVGAVIVADMLYNQLIVKYFTRSITIYVVPTVTCLLALSQYVCLLHALNERYADIKMVLQRMSSDVSNKRRASADVDDYRRGDYRMYGVLTVMVQSIDASSSSSKGFDSLPYELVLETLRKVHYELYRLGVDVSGSFGVLVVATVLTTFMILCTQLYAFYTFAEGIQVWDVYLFVYTVLWLTLHAGKLYLMLWLNHRVAIQVNLCILYILYQRS